MYHYIAKLRMYISSIYVEILISMAWILYIWPSYNINGNCLLIKNQLSFIYNNIWLVFVWSYIIMRYYWLLKRYRIVLVYVYIFRIVLAIRIWYCYWLYYGIWRNGIYVVLLYMVWIKKYNEIVINMSYMLLVWLLYWYIKTYIIN